MHSVNWVIHENLNSAMHCTIDRVDCAMHGMFLNVDLFPALSNPPLVIIVGWLLVKGHLDGIWKSVGFLVLLLTYKSQMGRRGELPRWNRSSLNADGDMNSMAGSSANLLIIHTTCSVWQRFLIWNIPVNCSTWKRFKVYLDLKWFLNMESIAVECSQ